MRTTFIRLPQILGSIALATFLFCSAGAKAADDHASLTGLKDVKVAFDLKEGDGKLLLSRLDVIDETRQSLIQQGVTPHFILAFRGPATKLVQADQDKIKPEDRAMAAKIATRIKEMSRSPGVDGFEQCAVAAREQGTRLNLSCRRSASSAMVSFRLWLIRPKATPTSPPEIWLAKERARLSGFA